MKRVCFSLLFSFLLFSASGQNLIPNPSVEDYIECPEHLGGWPDDGFGLDSYVFPWMSLRGTPDYFNSCQTNSGLAWNNDLGYQEPRTGDGYLGAVLYHTGLPNAKEIFGVGLIEPMVVGETYQVYFHVSMAFKEPGPEFACNRIGALLMTENYLYSGEQSPTPNQATFEISEILTDTTNWVEISAQVVADSAYTMIAFGVFYDVDSVDVISPYGGDGQGIAYYYFDDFCLTTNPEGCPFVVTTDDIEENNSFQIYPNSSFGRINVESAAPMTEYVVFDVQGRKILDGNLNSVFKVDLNLDLPNGLFLLQVQTKNGVQSKRVLINAK